MSTLHTDIPVSLAIKCYVLCGRIFSLDFCCSFNLWSHLGP